MYAGLFYRIAHKRSVKFVQKIEQNFQKSLDKMKRVFYNIKQNKRAEQMYTSAEKKRCAERILIMTTSNARNLTSERNITMTRRVARKNNLVAQKLVGVIMLVLVAIAFMIGGRFVGAAVLIPFALAAVFSKEKVLDFGIFSNKVTYYR